MASGAAEVNSQKKLPVFRTEEYTVGWICALPIELSAARALLDQTHAPLENQSSHDKNHYHLGAIGKHKVVITCLASAGNTNAAISATSMQGTFSGLRFGLMVGIGGGIPLKFDIRLGDIVVSKPAGEHGGVLQYDFGKFTTDAFRRTGSLNKPDNLLRGVLPTMETTKGLTRQIFEEVQRVFEEDEDSDEDWAYPGAKNDNLFKPTAVHVKDAPTCISCEASASTLVDRPARKRDWPKVHYGNIASGNAVVKDAVMRDRLGEEEDVICFEMEAAGLMDYFPCLVIRGISDYADSHKNDKWHRYAAAVAACYAKKLLEEIAPSAVQKMEPIQREWMLNSANSPSISRSNLSTSVGQLLVTDAPVHGSVMSVFDSVQPVYEYAE